MMQRLNERECVAGIALLAMFADGIIRPEEDEVLRDRLLAYPLFDALDEAELGAVLERVEKMSRDVGPEKFLRSCCEGLDADHADVAFAIAQEIVEADEEVAPEESDFLAKLDELLTV